MKRALSSTFFVVFIILSLLIPSLAHAADIKITVDGELIYTEVPPTIVEGRVLIPVRDIFDALGGSVVWESVYNQVYGSKGARKIWLTIGSSDAYNGNHEPVTLDVPAQIVNGRTMAPLRFIAESLGCQVDWDPVNMVVSIEQEATSPTEDAFTLVKSSIVEIKQGDALGTGFFFSNPDEIITNLHVVNGTGDIEVTTYNNKTYKADIESLEPIEDIAILKLDNTSDTYNPIYSYKTLGSLQEGEGVIAIGNPFGFENSLSTGIISGIRTIDDINQIQITSPDSPGNSSLIQTTAPISPGNSGGPLLTMDGDVIGITSYYIEGGENLNFAIPIDDYFSLKSHPPQEEINEITDFQTNDAEWEKTKNQIDTDATNALFEAQGGNPSGLTDLQNQVLPEIDSFRQSVSSYTATSPDVQYCIDLLMKFLNDWYDGNQELVNAIQNNDTTKTDDAIQRLSDADNEFTVYGQYRDNIFCILQNNK